MEIEPSKKHTVSEFTSIVGKQVLVTGIAGGCVGFVYATCTGKRILPTIFYMTTNWTVAALPLFTLRQSILTYRQPVSDSGEKDKMVASVMAGTVVGFGAGGPWAIIPAGLVHAVLSATTQSFFIKFDKWRIEKAIEYMNPEMKVKKRWNEDAFRRDASPYDPREEATFDPAKYLFDGVKSLFFGLFLDEPPSCVKHAADIEYRKKLNLKIAILRQQIQDLQVELKQKNISYRPE